MTDVKRRGLSHKGSRCLSPRLDVAVREGYPVEAMFATKHEVPERRVVSVTGRGVDNTSQKASWRNDWLLQAVDYWLDACQRTVLFMDIMRQRGNNYVEHIAHKAPHVLTFQFEVVLNGYGLKRPVNYVLLRIVPPIGTTIDERKRPFIVFDPRAGHGPGIGGMKHDSEIGVVLAAGHPCYFVGFLPEPVPGQTIEDVCRAEALFIKKVAELHHDAGAKPCLIGNCQAGWQIMMTSAIAPGLVGPIMLAGTPLSFWNGVRGKNPLRYLGGLLGGTWLTSLAGDVGHGRFDGACLVSNFEALNPANTYWEKKYNVYAKVDTEGPRFLEFEKWWGSPVLLNAIEMQFITDELFVGNRLAAGQIYTSENVRVDLRNIRSPIIVFCSFGDNITPPHQALGWILDLYDSDDDIVASGQTIVFALHQSIGHLGIFVSGKVATKQHQEFAQTMDMIDVLPPGLYEAVITEKGPDTPSAELAAGNYVMRFEPRTLGYLRALGGNDAEDDLRFATVARVSEINQSLYRTFVSPLVRMLSNEQTAEWMRAVHPDRLRYEMTSDRRNPLMSQVAAQAERIRAHRRPVADGNPFMLMEKEMSRAISRFLDGYQDVRDRLIESWFMNVYGSPVLQAAVGLRAEAAIAQQRIGRDVLRQAMIAQSTAALDARFKRGGMREAFIRALIYIAFAREQPGWDERAFTVLRQIRARMPERERVDLAQFKEIVRDQYLLLLRDEDRAVAAIPALLPDGADARAQGLEAIRHVIAARGELSSRMKERLAHVEALFRGATAPGQDGGDEFGSIRATHPPGAEKKIKDLRSEERHLHRGRETTIHK